MNSLHLFAMIILIFTILILIFLAYPLFFGAPFEITKKKDLEKILNFAKKNKIKNLAELGSGSGTIAIYLASNMKINKITCFEINPILVLYSKIKIKLLGLDSKIKVKRANFFDEDFSKYNSIVLYQFPTIMTKLEKKIINEVKPKTIIISNLWKFKNLDKKTSDGKIHVYEI